LTTSSPSSAPTLGGPVCLFPGQGSQSVGMGKALYEKSQSVRNLFDRASEIVGKDLQRLCFDGPVSELVETQNAQPAITVVNIACLQALRDEGTAPAAVAGHSLGEFAALYAAGVLSFEDTMRLVTVRGSAMKEAADRHPGGMVAVFGLDFDAVTAVCEEVTAKGAGFVEVANHNSPLQVVVTGELAALEQVPAVAKARGAKLLVPLKVSGAWHSRFMTAAAQPLSAALQAADVLSPAVPVIANITAAPYPADAETIRHSLVNQLSHPVLWASSMRRLIGEGHKVFLEVGPGKVLAGLLRDVTRDVKILGIQDPETLEKWTAMRMTERT
jgi:[acyl-carrier-protein] S-malonyltransferase